MKKIELTQTLMSALNEWLEFSKDEEKKKYIKNLIDTASEENSELTKKNLDILNWMKENKNTCNNIFTARQIGDGLFMSGRAISGGIRKLVELNFVEKKGKEPVCYSLTDKNI